MMEDEFDKYLASYHADDDEETPIEMSAQDYTNAVCSAAQSILIAALTTNNNLVITVTRTRIGGVVTFAATKSGTTVIVDSFLELLDALDRIK